jgi:hypothetical protein
LFLRQVYEDKMKLKGEKRREKKKINHVKMWGRVRIKLTKREEG